MPSDAAEPLRDARAVVLVVDDDAGLREACRLILEDEFEVLDAPDGPHALDVLRSTEVDVVLLDIRLPGMDGLELARRLRQNARYGGKLMIISGRLASDDMDQLATLQVHTILPKPFAVTDFLEAMRSALQAQPASGAVAAK